MRLEAFGLIGKGFRILRAASGQSEALPAPFQGSAEAALQEYQGGRVRAVFQRTQVWMRVIWRAK